MDLVSATAPPRYCRLGGEDLWIKPYTLRDLATILAWLDDVLPGKSDREVPPKFGDPVSQDALDSLLGRLLLAWVALRHLGYTYRDAALLVGRAEPEEWASFLAATFARRRTMGDEPGDGKDLADQWFGPNFATICERYPGHSVHGIGDLTLDQYALLASEGLEDERPGRLTFEQVEAMRQEGLRRMAEREKAEINGGGT